MVKSVRRKRVSRPKRRMNMRRRRGVRGKRSTPASSDYAKVVEAVELPLVSDATGSCGGNVTTTLSDYQRAQEVAHAYKWYRCAKVELIFVPYANTATYGGAAVGRLPQLYFTVDRVANQRILPTEDEMLSRGVKPILFKRNKAFVYKPSLLQNVQLETNQPAEGGGNPLGINIIGAVNSVPVFNKWLPTQQSYGFTTAPGNAQIGQQMVQLSQNPYALRYYGACYLIDQEGGPVNTSFGDLMYRVTWEFKGARALKTNAPAPQAIYSPATSMMTPGVVANSQPTQYP